MSGFTPGPWRWEKYESLIGADDRVVLGAQDEEPYGFSFPRWQEEETEANIQLIAAAPDLLEALRIAHQALLEVSHAHEQGAGWYTKGENGLRSHVRMWLERSLAPATAALSKATGK